MLPLELVQQQPGTGSVPLPQLVAGPTGLLVFFAFLIDGVWRFARHISVTAHEGAHVAAGWSVGRRVSGVELNRDATGATTTRGSGGFGSVIFSFAGYLGPSLFGLATACLIALDQITLALGLALFCLAIMLILIRNFFGVMSVAISGVLVFLVLRYGSPEVQAVTACALSWFLLFSGVRWVLMHGTGARDATILTQSTHIPRFIWVTFWLAITVAALWVGGHLLIKLLTDLLNLRDISRISSAGVRAHAPGRAWLPCLRSVAWCHGVSDAGGQRLRGIEPGPGDDDVRRGDG